MSWIHDDSKTQIVTMDAGPPPQGFARVVSVTTDKTTAKPGDAIVITGKIHNDGVKDALRIVIGFQEFLDDAVDTGKYIDADTDYELRITKEIPPGYTGSTITAICYGFHDDG